MKDARMIQCDGEAHTNGYQDHCAVCMPYWGWWAACPTCERTGVDGDQGPVRLKLSGSSYSGRCPSCSKRFVVPG